MQLFIESLSGQRTYEEMASCVSCYRNTTEAMTPEWLSCKGKHYMSTHKGAEFLKVSLVGVFMGWLISVANLM